MKPYTPKQFFGCDAADALARNWIDSISDQTTQERMPNSAIMVNALAASANYLLAHACRVNASLYASNPYALTDETLGADPLYIFDRLDAAGNARVVDYHVLLAPRYATEVDASGLVWVHDNTDESICVACGLDGQASWNIWDDLFYKMITHFRGDAADAHDDFGVSTSDGPIVVSIVVQDRDIAQLDTGSHPDYALLTEPGKVITEQIHDGLRGAVQTIREDYLPIIASWSAQKPESGASPTSSDETGLVVQGTGYANLLDTSYGVKTGSAPGIIAHVPKFGAGDISVHDNKKVKVIGRVLASDTAGNGWFLAQGTTLHDDGGCNCGVANVTATTPTWYDVPAFYLDSVVADDMNNATANKIDIFGRSGSSSGYLRVYAYSFQLAHI